MIVGFTATPRIVRYIHTGSGALRCVTAHRSAPRRRFHNGCVAACVAWHCGDARRRDAPRRTGSGVKEPLVCWNTCRRHVHVILVHKQLRAICLVVL